MKQFTLEQIAEALQEHMSLEYNSDTKETYYHIHLAEDGSLIDGLTNAEENFSAKYWGPDMDNDSFDRETLENEYFKEVCEDLLEQVNDYIAE